VVSCNHFAFGVSLSTRVGTSKCLNYIHSRIRNGGDNAHSQRPGLMTRGHDEVVPGIML